MDADAAIAELPLIDHHVHGATADALDAGEFEGMLTEANRPAPGAFDSQLGFAVRRWCAPVLGLDPHCLPGEYLERRGELGAAEVNRLLLSGAGVHGYLLDTGWGGGETLGVEAMARHSGAATYEIVRLETLAEQVAGEGVSAAGYAEEVAVRIAERASHAVGFKSIVGYRFGLDFDPVPPGAAQIRRAAGHWLRRGESQPRLADPVLLRHLLWTAMTHRLPLQLHTGYGDPDLELHRVNPLLLTEWLRRTEALGTPVMLLHCYPYHREAGYLAQIFRHVYFDVGLALNHVGARAGELVAESFELAPFGKQLYSSDAAGPAELHFLGAVQWRRAMRRVLGEWVAEDLWSASDAVRVAELVGAGNARRVYRLD